MMEAVATEQKLDKKLDTLLNQFEREVEPYDRWAGISMFTTPVGVIASIFVPLILTLPSLEITGSALWWIIGGIVATIGLSRIPCSMWITKSTRSLE